MARPIACVIGDLSLIRALGGAGVPVAVVTSVPEASLTRSRYCRRVVAVPSFVDRPDEAVGALVAFAATEAERPVLYPQGDHDLLAISRARARLQPHFRFVLPEAELVEDLVDKLRFARLAHRLSLPVPLTWTIERGQVGALERWEAFPCIVKPATRAHWFGSRLQREAIGSNQKAVRVASRYELMRLLPLLARHETDFVVQEAIPGGEEHILSYHAYLRADGTRVAEFTGRKLRTSPRLYGLSTCVEITDDERVLALGRDVLEALAFSGVVKLDFKEHAETGQLYLLEANPRFNLWHHPGAIAGVNIPWLVYQDLCEPERVVAPVARARAGVRWVTARQDLQAMREYRAAGELDVGTWLMQVATADVAEDLYWRDPLPGLIDAWTTLKRLGGRLGARPGRPPRAVKHPG
jgi:D-aspartate ligase